jgi:hypothetical protein
MRIYHEYILRNAPEVISGLSTILTSAMTFRGGVIVNEWHRYKNGSKLPAYWRGDREILLPYGLFKLAHVEQDEAFGNLYQFAAGYRF